MVKNKKKAVLPAKWPLERILSKHGKKFLLFMAIGILKTGYSVGLSWLLIDFLGFWSLFSSAAITASEFFLTYAAYRSLKVIKKGFVMFTSASLVFNIAYVLSVWVMVDFIGFSGFVSSAIVIAVLFVLRYAFFSRMGLIDHDI